MVEYIERDLAEKALLDRCEETGYGGLNRHDVTLVMRTPWRIPNADVVPRKDYESMERTVDKLNKALAERKHGMWIGIPHKTTSKRNRTIHSMVYICPLCRYSNGRHKSNFCPNCGAWMESEGEDGDMQTV